ncbi:MAG: zinc ribbon domain-containing protein [Gammaproteobacteria bacterium]|nr:zinc ribbon domain-containing protein [Gammaproteobacteria bacterium]
MPIYEYSCSACGHHLEAFQKMSDAPLQVCPECHKPTLTKLISAAGFQLKGTGWYATDFKNKGKPEEKPTQSTDTKNSGSEKSEKETKPIDTKDS